MVVYVCVARGFVKNKCYTEKNLIDVAFYFDYQYVSIDNFNIFF